MHTMSRISSSSSSSSSTGIPSLHHSSAAPSLPFFLLLLLIILLWSSSLPAAAGHQYSDEDAITTSFTASAWPLLQRPTPSLSLSLMSGSENLPLPRPAAAAAAEQQQQQQQQLPRDEQDERLPKQGASKSQEAKKYWSAVGRGKCSYTVTIKTSCSSPRITRDAVSLTFGDVYRNEVYAERLDDPASSTFERCSVDTFRIVGPCGGDTCYLYLRRSGRDGWTPESVKVFNTARATAVSFFYKVPLPNGVWYGFNLCHGGAAATQNAAKHDIIVDEQSNHVGAAMAAATTTR